MQRYYVIPLHRRLGTPVFGIGVEGDVPAKWVFDRFLEAQMYDRQWSRPDGVTPGVLQARLVDMIAAFAQLSIHGFLDQELRERAL